MRPRRWRSRTTPTCSSWARTATRGPAKRSGPMIAFGGSIWDDERPSSSADAMKPFFKVGVVAIGYVVAILLASAAVAIRVATTSGPDAQASSGMHAFGDALLFVAVFGISALVPTAVALVFLRPYRQFWTLLSVVGLAVAVTGVIAAALFEVG